MTSPATTQPAAAVPAVLPKLDAAAVKRLADTKGPCITISLPEFRPGAQSASRALHLRNALRDLRALLDERALAASASALLEPLENAAKHEPETGGPGRVLFAAPRMFERFDADVRDEGQSAVGSYFLMTPFLATVFAPRDFLILALSRKTPRLIEFSAGTCRELPWPDHLPRSLEEANAYDASGQDLQSYSTAGPGKGNMRGVQFGTSTERESAKESLRQYFVTLDRGLKAIRQGRPLLLMSVQEEMAAYRQASQDPLVWESPAAGNADGFTLAQFAEEAAIAAAQQYDAAAEQALEQFHQLDDPLRKSDDVRAILRAAHRGRVHQLCVRGATEVRGKLWPEMDEFHLDSEDLLNAAAVETIRQGGTVYVVPPDRMSVSNPAAAVLRY